MVRRPDSVQYANVAHVKSHVLAFLLLFVFNCSFSQAYKFKIDSLFSTDSKKQFNGIVVIARGGKVEYFKAVGVADIASNTPLQEDSQFFLGSISKQFTATLVLLECQAGRLKLNDHIGKYLPELKMSWRDSVTIHQLLNHSSGIAAIDKPLKFMPGTQFYYSAVLAYQLLSKIVEKTSGKEYSTLINDLVKSCGMKSTIAPRRYNDGNLVNGYHLNEVLVKDNFTLHKADTVAPGAAIISSAMDLKQWNDCLHKGKIINKALYRVMITPSVIRDHPLWGKIGYGYGVQIDSSNNLLEISHSGAYESYNSINFYYPESNTSAIVLTNVDYYDDDITKSFFFHVEIRKIVYEELLKDKKRVSKRKYK